LADIVVNQLSLHVRIYLRLNAAAILRIYGFNAPLTTTAVQYYRQSNWVLPPKEFLYSDAGLVSYILPWL